MKTAKLLFIFLAIVMIVIAFILGSCTKEDVTPGNRYRLYNDPNNLTEMIITPGSVDFYMNGEKVVSVIDDDILSGSFEMPLIWDYTNPEKVGTWIQEVEYLRYYYTGIDGKTYRMDFVDEKYLH